MTKKAQITPVVITPLQKAEGHVYGGKLGVEYQQESYNKELANIVKRIHDLANEVQRYADNENTRPHERIQYIQNAVGFGFANLNMGGMFRTAHELENAEKYLVNAEKELAVLKGE